MVNILFVCSGNIFRSMSAEYLAKKYVQEQKETRMHIKSAGIVAKKHPQDAHPQTQKELEKRNIDFSKHTQTQLTQEHIKWADRIVCMAENHREYISTHFNADSHLFYELAVKKTRDVKDLNDVMKKEEFTGKKGNAHVKKIIQKIEQHIPQLIENILHRTYIFEEFVNGTRKRNSGGAQFEPIIENKRALAFLSEDTPPNGVPHILIIPKKRYENYHDIPQTTLTDMNKLVCKIAYGIEKNYEGYNIVLNNGRCADQYIYHAHIHLIPRTIHDENVKYKGWKTHKVDGKTLHKLTKQVKTFLE